MANYNFIDFYIGYPGHPRFRDPELIEDDLVRVIVQKYEMIIFTNKGEVLCEPNFGADLTLLLHETRLSATAIEAEIRAQIADYIPEIEGIEFEVLVEFFDHPTRHLEYMVINFQIAGYQVLATVN
jgi:hypothetical protein